MMASPLAQCRIIDKIMAERRAQDAKWGEQNHDDYRWLAILMEEVGEAAQAILQTEFGGKVDEDIEMELVQAAAVIVSWLEARRRR